MSDESKKNGYTIKPLFERNPLHKEYAESMAAALREKNPPKPKPIKPDGMSQEDWIFSMQSKSTQEIITNQKDPNYKRDWTAPLPDNVLANPNAKTKEELVGERSLSTQEILNYHSPGKYNTLGQSDGSCASEETRARAVHHFMVSPPALLTEAEMNSLKKLTAPAKGIPATQYVTKKISSFKAFIHWLRGGKVWTEKNE